jgi:hypothetical protein
MSERTRYAPGAFCWVGLATSDPPGAKIFYTGLFGWQAEDLSASETGTYTLLRLAGLDVAILLAEANRLRRCVPPLETDPALPLLPPSSTRVDDVVHAAGDCARQ